MSKVFKGITNALTGRSSSSSRANKQLENMKPVNISGGGFSSSIANNTLNLTADPSRQAAVAGIQNVLNTGADQLSGMREQVTPGFGALTDARVGALTDARQRAIGTLRENLGRRRVLGSSFGADALSRAESQFGREEAEMRAQSFLQELDMSTQLIERETALRTTSASAALDELNLQASVATQLASGATAMFQANASVLAQLAARRAAANQQFLGDMIGTVGAIAKGAP